MSCSHPLRRTACPPHSARMPTSSGCHMTYLGQGVHLGWHIWPLVVLGIADTQTSGITYEPRWKLYYLTSWHQKLHREEMSLPRKILWYATLGRERKPTTGAQDSKGEWPLFAHEQERGKQNGGREAILRILSVWTDAYSSIRSSLCWVYNPSCVSISLSSTLHSKMHSWMLCVAMGFW